MKTFSTPSLTMLTQEQQANLERLQKISHSIHVDYMAAYDALPPALRKAVAEQGDNIIPIIAQEPRFGTVNVEAAKEYQRKIKAVVTKLEAFNAEINR